MTTEESKENKKGKGPGKIRARQDNRAKFVLYSAIFFACLLLLYTIIGDQGIIDLYQFQLKIHSLESEIREIDRANDSLREKIRLLRDDPYYIEGLAREELGLIKPGEVIYYIKNNRHNSKKD